MGLFPKKCAQDVEMLGCEHRDKEKLQLYMCVCKNAHTPRLGEYASLFKSN